ncbi:hypothetical protein W04_0214 [Pseudoalteromonas sp. SW0106-04]|nr:hypothetical protein W04_0214 [Pseudoalteromonas sp. SW0106-04]
MNFWLSPDSIIMLVRQAPYVDFPDYYELASFDLAGFFLSGICYYQANSIIFARKVCSRHFPLQHY